MYIVILHIPLYRQLYLLLYYLVFKYSINSPLTYLITLLLQVHYSSTKAQLSQGRRQEIF